SLRASVTSPGGFAVRSPLRDFVHLKVLQNAKHFAKPPGVGCNAKENNYIKNIMKLKFIIPLLSITIFTSCNFINNTIEYNDSSKEFMNTILKENVDKSLPYFALESESAKNVDINQMKNGLEEFRTKIL